jgi:mannose-6-phosphate isomerase-like protein (cupin superfamily)
MKSRYQDIKPYVTKDGSIIRELMHPDVHGNQNQSLAEATVPVGVTTLLHRHQQSEEIYHITSGVGLMRLGDTTFEVKAGDCVTIAPGTLHNIQNTGEQPLTILCSCAPPYRHDDTVIIDEENGDSGISS